MGRGLAAALPRDGQARVGSGRALHAIGQHDDVPELLQAAGAADRVRELRCPQRHADSDPGPMDSTKLVGAGSWSAYWYNGYIVSSEISRGLDIFELQPSAFISQNELDAAKLIHFDYLNAQDQQQLVWPASFVVARAYVDQLARVNGLSRERCGAITATLRRAEQLQGDARRGVLQQLATDLQRDAQAAADQAKLRTLAATVTDLAGAAR